MDKSWKVIVAFLGVFVAGAVFGGFFSLRIAQRVGRARMNAPMSPPPGELGGNKAGGPGGGPRGMPFGRDLGPEMLKMLEQRLELNAAQREKIGPIVTRAETEVRKLQQENFRDMAKVFERMHAEIAAHLTGEQKLKLDEMQKRMQERRDGFMSRGGGWRGGPGGGERGPGDWERFRRGGPPQRPDAPKAEAVKPEPGKP